MKSFITRYSLKFLISDLLIFLRTILFALGLATSVFVEASTLLSETSAKAIKETVQAQLAAFAVDDADTAFSYAAPTVRDVFKTAENFVAMVQQAYQVVYRPANVLFLSASGTDSSAVQPVRMRDQNGNSWLATYKLERQTDGRWLIIACILVREPTAIDITLAD